MSNTEEVKFIGSGRSCSPSDRKQEVLLEGESPPESNWLANFFGGARGWVPPQKALGAARTARGLVPVI